MKILVQHDTHHNLGDLAMLEVALRQLLESPGGVQLYTKECRLEDVLWRNEHVHPLRFNVPAPGQRLWDARCAPWIEHYKGAPITLWRLFRYAMLDRFVAAGRNRIHDGSGARRLAAWCAPFDALYVAGGGNLNDVFPSVFWHTCSLIHAFADQGKPVVLTGQQLGPFRFRATKAALERALKRVTFLGLREPGGSLDFCRRSGLSEDRYAVMGDDSLGLPASAPGLVRAMLSEQGLSPGEFLAVNLRVGPYVENSVDHLSLVADGLARIQRKLRMPLLVVPISLNDYDSDVRSGRRLVEALDGDVRMLDGAGLTAAHAKGLVGQAHAAIGVSYHFCTFALTQGVPAISLFGDPYYSQKAHGLCGFWGDDRLAMPIKGLSSDSALSRMCGLMDDMRFREHLRVRADEALESWHELFESRARPSLLGHAAAT